MDTSQPIPQPRPIERVQFIHDMLDMILNGDIPMPHGIEGDPVAWATVTNIKTILCWVLNHKAGQDANEFLERLEAWYAKHGYEFTKELPK